MGTNLLPQISYLDSITKSLFDLDPDVKIDLILILIKKGECFIHNGGTGSQKAL